LPAPWASGPACSNLTIICQRLPRLFADLELAHGDGRFARLFRSLVKADLLILDDRGPDRLTAGQRRDLMEIVEDRHGRGSILITSQLPVTAWHDVIDEPTFADAILDRVRRRPSGLNRWRRDGQLLEPMTHQWLTPQHLSPRTRRPFNAALGRTHRKR